MKKIYLVTEVTYYKNIYDEWEKKYETNFRAFANEQKAIEYAKIMNEFCKNTKYIDILRKAKIEILDYEE